MSKTESTHRLEYIIPCIIFFRLLHLTKYLVYKATKQDSIKWKCGYYRNIESDFECRFCSLVYIKINKEPIKYDITLAITCIYGFLLLGILMKEENKGPIYQFHMSTIYTISTTNMEKNFAKNEGKHGSYVPL